MSAQQAEGWTRRRFLGGLTLAGTAGLLGLHPSLLAAEPPPESTRIRLVRIPSICQAPSYVAEELLRSEGFTEVHYLKTDTVRDLEMALASGEANLNGHFAAPLLLRLEAGTPSSSSRDSTSAASNSSRRTRSVPSATCRGRPSPCPPWIPPGMSFSPAWWRISG
jgi:hypothetical protein